MINAHERDPAVYLRGMQDAVDAVASGKLDPSALFDHVVVDKARLARHIRHALQVRGQITLSELVNIQPLQQGLAELVAYLQLGSEAFSTVVDEDTLEPIRWQAVAADGEALTRSARMPRMIFMR